LRPSCGTDAVSSHPDPTNDLFEFIEFEGLIFGRDASVLEQAKGKIVMNQVVSLNKSHTSFSALFLDKESAKPTLNPRWPFGSRHACDAAGLEIHHFQRLFVAAGNVDFRGEETRW
jgi:hypothetical protein